jgi:hypothetical protein
MRAIRNVTLVLFLALAFATTAEIDVRADQCTDLRNHSECVACGGEERPGPVCYVLEEGGCEAADCYNEQGPQPMCDYSQGEPPTVGDDFWFCVCDPCPGG